LTNRLPSLRSIFLSVWTEEFLTAVHGIDAVIYMCAFLDEHRRLTVLSSAEWENSIADCFAGVGWYDGAEAECFGE